MGLLDAVKDQFLDVIEYVDQSNTNSLFPNTSVKAEIMN